MGAVGLDGGFGGGGVKELFGGEERGREKERNVRDAPRTPPKKTAIPSTRLGIFKRMNHQFFFYITYIFSNPFFFRFPNFPQPLLAPFC